MISFLLSPYIFRCFFRQSIFSHQNCERWDSLMFFDAWYMWHRARIQTSDQIEARHHQSLELCYQERSQLFRSIE